MHWISVLGCVELCKNTDQSISWIDACRTPAYMHDASKILNIVRSELDGIPAEALTTMRVKEALLSNNVRRANFDAIPFIISAYTGDNTYIRVVREEDKVLSSQVIRWEPTLRRSHTSFSNTFISHKALLAIGQADAAEAAFRKRVVPSKLQSMDTKWQRMFPCSATTDPTDPTDPTNGDSRDQAKQ